LLRSIGYHDTAPMALSSLYRQTPAVPSLGASVGADSKPVDDAIPLQYEQMTASVAERLDRLARLTTDNFLRAQAELDWEEERASLVSVELDSLHLNKLHGPGAPQPGGADRRTEGVASSCNPIAGFTQAPFGSGQRSAGSSAERWDKGGRIYRMACIVESINVDKWGPSNVAAGLQPFKDLSIMTNDSTQDRTLDSSEDATVVPNSAHSHRSCGLGGGQHWRYLAELYRILHSIVTPLHARQLANGAVALSKVDIEEALVRGSLHHLHAQFRGMIRTIFDKMSSPSRNLGFTHEETLCSAVQLHLDYLKISGNGNNKSLWPKVLPPAQVNRTVLCNDCTINWACVNKEQKGCTSQSSLAGALNACKGKSRGGNYETNHIPTRICVSYIYIHICTHTHTHTNTFTHTHTHTCTHTHETNHIPTRICVLVAIVPFCLIDPAPRGEFFVVLTERLLVLPASVPVSVPVSASLSAVRVREFVVQILCLMRCGKAKAAAQASFSFKPLFFVSTSDLLFPQANLSFR